MSNWLIYKTTNKKNGKIYIGQHKQEGIDFDGYLGSGLSITRAINKYGKDSFVRETLSITESKYQADLEEIHFIKMYREAFGEDMMYNINEGGQGGDGTKYWTSESKKRMVEGIKNSWNSERKQKQSEWMKDMNRTHNLDHNHMSGKHHSEEAKQKISAHHLSDANTHRKMIQCIETGDIFKSIKDAAKSMNLYASGISNVLSGKYKYVGSNKYTFKYL